MAEAKDRDQLEFLDALRLTCQTTPMTMRKKTPIPHPNTVAEAAAILEAGEVCAFATETVYGLGADATNAEAVLKIYERKGRPRFNPLIVHCADFEMAETLVRFNPKAKLLAQHFWPGPLTLVLPLRTETGLADLVTAGLGTLGVRVPDSQTARALIAQLGRPIAAPSANPSGRLSPTSAAQVRHAFADQVPVLDAGPCRAGVESSIIGFDGDEPVQLRPGAIARSDIEAVLREPVRLAEADGQVSAPGMLKSHYAPHARLRLEAREVGDAGAYLGFGAFEAEGVPTRNLSPSSDLSEAARNLFAHLDALDKSGAKIIAVAPIPNHGLGEAINDRLHRAAAPRD